MATKTESRLEPSSNGSAGTIADRVQQLRLDDQLAGGGGKPGLARGALLPWVLCGLLAVAWVGVGVRWYKAPRQGEGAAGAPAAPGVNPAPAQPSGSQPAGAGGPQVAAGELVTQLKGTVIPSLQITVSPRDVAAEITNINFAEGKRVKQGEVLATLLDAQYANRLKSDEAAWEASKAMVTRAKAAQASAKAKVAKAEAALAAAKARVTRAVATQDRAEKDYAQAVEQRKVGAIAAQEYQKFEADKRAADADKVAADADVEAARREIEAADAELNTAAANITSAEADERAAAARRKEAARLVDNCTVRAPIDGTILTKSADKGALVSPMSFNVAAGICTIADLSKLEVEIDVPERQITRIEKGQACVLQADADPTREYRGVVDRVMPIADDTKNVVKVRVRVYLRANEEQGSFLKPKMSVTASVYNRPFAFDGAKDQAWGDETK